MTKLPLNSLATFVVAARSENLRAAAEHLHLTHGAISQQIGALEDRMGFKVFERRGRSIKLNAAGRTLLAGVEPALQRIQESVQAAAVAAGGAAQTLRMTILPSFAQRWLMPRMGRWRAGHPDITLEIEASARIVDLERDGYHVGLRTGDGPWPGLVAEPLYEMPCRFVVVGSPDCARRLAPLPPSAIAHEPLLDDGGMWPLWFEAAGFGPAPPPAATFNDQGLLLQATEQGMGITVVRELLAIDALLEGRLVQLSHIPLLHGGVSPHCLVYPAGLRDWPPLLALRTWLKDELARSMHELARRIEPR